MEYCRLYSDNMQALWELHLLYKQAICEDKPDGDAFLRLKKALEEERILFYGAREGTKLVGCCSVTVGFSTFSYSSSGVFEDFFILPENRHRGIARGLVRFAYRESGVSSMTVGCADCDEGMYRALGFTLRLGNLLAFE